MAIRVHALVMGWSWAVWMAQAGSRGLLEKVDLKFGWKYFRLERTFVEGTPVPQDYADFHVGYIDDVVVCFFGGEEMRARRNEVLDAARS